MGCTDFFVLLYHEILQLKDGFSMDGVNEDVFFLSNGHIALFGTAHLLAEDSFLLMS